MAVKILHTADLHIGSGRTGVKNGKAEIENTFFRIIDLCKSENIDFLLIAGDLFNSPFITRDTAEKVISAISQIPETIVAISPGNHDFVCPGSVYYKYKFSDNVIIFSSFLEYRDFPEKNVRLWGAGFTDRFESLPLLQINETKSNDFLNLCVLHGEVVADNSPSVYNPIYPGTIRQSGFDYLALGHIHKFSDIEKLGNTYFAYSGSPDGMGFDETGSHGVYIGSVSKGSCELSRVELSSRQYIETSFDITSYQNLFGIADSILEIIKQSSPESYAQNLYRINLTGEVSASFFVDTAQLSKLLSEKLFFVEVTDKTTTDVSDLLKLANETSLRGVFVKKAIEKISAASSDEEASLKNALKIGLQAFSKEVTLNDN